MIDVFV